MKRMFGPSCRRAVLIGVWSAVAQAGGGPQNVLVVVNEQDKSSVELGRYYMEKRGIPARNLCRINLPSLDPNIIPPFFEKYIRRPMEKHIEKEGLARQIDFLVLCWNAPSRVNEIESITAALSYGFKKAPGAPPCALPPGTSNLYHQSERAFVHSKEGGGRPAYLAMMLAAPSLEEAKQLVDRSVAADGTAPSGTFYLLEPPGDPARNVRYKLFDEFDFRARLVPEFPRRVIVEENMLGNLPDVMGYQTGLPGYPESFWKTNTYRPGAIADHLTSFGGQLPVPALGQSSALQWIGAGASASYGTVSEPCNFPAKFPDPLVYYWYARGFNLAESYWMSVAHPYQGLFIGDPLTAPYARPPSVSVSGLEPDQAVSGVVTVRVVATGTAERPCEAIDYYLDDLFVDTLTNVTPQAWNEIHLEVEDQSYSYILGDTDDLFRAVEGVARDVRKRNPMLNAIPMGDRLMLMDGRIGKAGSTTPVKVRVEAGLGPAPALTARALTPTFLDSLYPARKQLLLRGPANQGDAVECLLTLADGATGTARVEAVQGEAAAAVVERLAQALREHPVLKTEKGVRLTHVKSTGPQVEFSLEAARRGAPGIALLLKYRIRPARTDSGLGPAVTYEGRLGDTLDLLSSRALLQFACGSESLRTELVIDTAGWPDGAHTLRFVARDGTAVQTQGHSLLPLSKRPTDARPRP